MRVSLSRYFLRSLLIFVCVIMSRMVRFNAGMLVWWWYGSEIDSWFGMLVLGPNLDFSVFVVRSMRLL